MGLSGEQVPPQAAHCLAGLTMGPPQPQCRPPPRPEPCTGAMAPGGAGPRSVRRRCVCPRGLRAPGVGSRARAPGVRACAQPACQACGDPARRRCALGLGARSSCAVGHPARLAGTARAAASRAHTQGPILPGSAQPYGKSTSTQQPPLIQAQNVPQQGTITTLFASIMDANGREKKII